MYIDEGFISPDILDGFSDPAVVAKALATIDERLALEREWHEASPKYEMIRDILGAVATGELVQVFPDENIKPAMRFTNELLSLKYPPYLHPHAASVLAELGRLWRVEADFAGVHPNIRLSVSSMVRSQAYQNLIVERGKLGVRESTHKTGFTFDMDFAGYHVENYFLGRPATVSRRETAKQEVIAKAFARDYGVCNEPPIRLGPEFYQASVMDAL